MTVVGLAAVAVGTHHSSSSAATGPCRTVEFVWNSPSTQLVMLASLNSTLTTGVTITAPGSDETATVISSGWSSYDRYAEGASPSREDHDQQHESWGIAIGGTPFGGLTTDVPDQVSGGAASPWYSGMITGSFGAGAIGGGELVLVHSSRYGFTESENSVHPSSVSLLVEYCPASTTTTVAATTTTAPAPTSVDPTTTDPTSTVSTTIAESTTTATDPPTTQPAATTAPTPISAPSETTTPALPTTTPPVSATAPTTIPLTPAGPTVPTSTSTSVPTSSPIGGLPATGSEVGGLLQVGGSFVALGAALGLIRRRRLA
jgi:LPXTG-motif cell wall-anchored protein